MTHQSYPSSPSAITRWAEESNLSVNEAERRYVQSLILRSISANRLLRDDLVFKGGNALEFVYLPNRSTTDLDFSFRHHHQNLAGLKESLTVKLDQSLTRVKDGEDTLLRLQSIEQMPPGENKTHPTFRARVAYALSTQKRQHFALSNGEYGANVIAVEISVNENVCAWRRVNFEGGFALDVATLEDIVAEKLRAILQQSSRNRYRSQDVLDIAVIMVNQGNLLDIKKISTFLPEKCIGRGITPTRSTFHDEDVRFRAARDYDALRDTVHFSFIHFDEAWSLVLSLVDELDIPD